MRPVPAVLVASFLLLTACAPVTNEPAGSGNYFLNNQSSQAVRVQAVGAIGAPTSGLSEPVAPGEVAEFASDAQFGDNPRPTTSFDSIRVLAEDDSVLTELFPIADDAFDAEPQDELEYGVVHWTLSVTDDDFTGPVRTFHGGEERCRAAPDTVEGFVFVFACPEPEALFEGHCATTAEEAEQMVHVYARNPQSGDVVGNAITTHDDEARAAALETDAAAGFPVAWSLDVSTLASSRGRLVLSLSTAGDFGPPDLEDELTLCPHQEDVLLDEAGAGCVADGVSYNPSCQ